MDTNSEQLDYPPYDFEEIEIKNEPLEINSENEQEFVDETNDELFEGDLELEKDVDPFNFLKLHLTSEDLITVKDSQTSSRKRKKHACNICFKEYVDLKSIRRHLLRIHDIEPPIGTVMYECPECFDKFSDKSHLDRHTLKHTGVKAFVCKKCNKAFSRKEHLARHSLKVRCNQVKEQKEVKMENVKINEKSDDLRETKPKKTGIQEENTERSIDGEGGSNFLIIQNVESVHTEFPQCNICSKKFVHQTHLRVHMKTHNVPPTKFECPICGKNLSRKDHLNHHIKRLHGTKSVVANHSEKSIPGDYACNLCPKTFVESAAYDKHLAMHSNNQIKKEVCDICNHVFLSKWHVRKHKLHKHNIEPENGCLACVYCDKKFIDNYYLRRHYTTKHKNDPFPQDIAVITKVSGIEEYSREDESLSFKQK